MTNVLHDTRLVPVAAPRHRKPESMLDLRAAWLAVIEAFNAVWPFVVTVSTAGPVCFVVGQLLVAASIAEYGPVASIRVGAVIVEAIVIAPLGCWVAAFLCDRIDAKASKTSSATRGRKVARP